MKDISRFGRTSDYLPLLNGAIIADLVVSSFVILVLKGRPLQKWYAQYGLSAGLADVLAILLALIIARAIYPFISKQFVLWKFLLVVLLVQMTHDLLFYAFFKAVPKGFNGMLDFFKGYAADFGARALAGDACLVVLAGLLAAALAGCSLNINIVIFVAAVYVALYFMHA